jgi:hypothetical protein
MAGPHTPLDLGPGESRRRVVKQVGFTPGKLILLPVMHRYALGCGREVIPEIFDELEFLRRAQIED